jgi:hypothetical protein
MNGMLFEVYLDVVSLITELSEEQKRWFPFIFPIQWAKSLVQGTQKKIQISDPIFRRDLSAIGEEVRAPIVLLFDECNVLSSSKASLQKLRNIFTHIAGYMLVFSGTPDLFPTIDEVFSPIARDFVSIEVSAFDNEEESKECVAAPLKLIGIDDPEKVFDSETLRDLVRLKGVASGNPYEIQLLCHTLLKRRNAGTNSRQDTRYLQETCDKCPAHLERFST